ncbi:MAG: DUF2950 domain-containing protein [Chelatococcus sp.]|nr:MAG: DUF2950 domain-containing protein [Chelatococcus sp.]
MRHALRRQRACLIRIGLVPCALLAGIALAEAQQPFRRADDAASALAEAVRSGDRARILKVLGRRGEDIVSSGDKVADSANRQRFLTAYDQQHRVAQDGSRATLIVGANEFPFPIPVVRRNGRWRFDTEAGRQEILFRRIGRNELDTIQTALAYVDAQREYAEKDRTGAGPGVFAQRIVSSPGTRDGLFWPGAPDGGESPLGEFVASAAAEGYRAGDRPIPYHGYVYKVLTRQGPDAAGGAMDYLVDGRMKRGFALLAYPADYGNSGVMSFLVNQLGVVFQKDMGPGTERIARRMTSFNPDRSWKVADTPARPTQ